MKKLILIPLVCLSFTIFSQDSENKYDTLTAKIKYFGKDIFVKNPFDSEGGLGFTCQEVWVNGKESETEVNQSAFGIKLGERKEGEDITIEIIYTRGSRPVILNWKAS